MSKNIISAVLKMLAAIAVMALSFYSGYAYKKLPLPEVTFVETVDTVFVKHTITNTHYTDRYYPVIDTVFVNGLNSEIATLDTLITGDGYEVSTNVKYHYPDRYFAFLQKISVDRDTVFINKDRMITNTVTTTKTNWTATAIGTLAGFIGGAIFGASN